MPKPLRQHRPAFTLIEMLIVIGVIVLMLAIAMPLMNALTGQRSIDGAANQLSALLNSARARAMADQRITGIMFFIDPDSQRQAAAMVYATESQLTDSAFAAVDVFLDLVPADGSTRSPQIGQAGSQPFTYLPAGVSLQTLDNSDVDISKTPPERKDDGYLGFNLTKIASAGGGTGTAITTPVGGVILFDSTGQTVSVTYGYRFGQIDYAKSQRIMTALGGLLYQTKASEGDNVAANYADGFSVDDKGNPPNSQFGLILVDRQRFLTAANEAGSVNSDADADADPQYNTNSPPYAAGEIAEETWLDNNAIPLLVNRYNGTLMKGE